MDRDEYFQRMRDKNNISDIMLSLNPRMRFTTIKEARKQGAMMDIQNGIIIKTEYEPESNWSLVKIYDRELRMAKSPSELINEKLNKIHKEACMNIWLKRNPYEGNEE